MTISTSAASIIVLGNGSSTSFNIPFICDAAEFIDVIYTDTNGTQTTLTSSQYTLVLNTAATGQIWGIGGTLTYPTVGSPIASGTSLTISRVLPYTQAITISNQGEFAPQVIEEMGDTLEMQIQQVAARTGQLRGTWVTAIDYTFGDVVIDGANGSNTGNFYMCVIGNTSGVWATDLAAGDWTLAITAAIPSAPLPLSLTSGGTHADLSATGGTSKVLMQTTAGANITVAQLSASNLSNGTTGSGVVVLSSSFTGTGALVYGTSPTLTTPTLGVAAATSIALSGTAALSNYQTGTWVASFSSQGGGTVTINAGSVGRYVRIGEAVMISGSFNVSSISNPSGELRLTGLPFTSGAVNGGNTAVAVNANLLLGGATTAVQGIIPQGTTYIRLERYAAGQAANLATYTQGTTTFVISGWYPAS